MAADDELQRWAADHTEQEARRAAEPALAGSDLRRWDQRENWKRFVAELYVDEQVDAAVVAHGGGPLASGLLALTDRRLIHVRAGLGRSKVLSIPRGLLRAITIAERPAYSAISVTTERDLFEFNLVPTQQAWHFLGCWLAGNESLPGEREPWTALVQERPVLEPEPAPEVWVSSAGQDFIEKRGGVLYLWQEPFNNALLLDKLSLERPDGLAFWTLYEDEITVLVADGIPSPRWAEVELARLPRPHVTVAWDGDRWGRRGLWDGGLDGPF